MAPSFLKDLRRKSKASFRTDRSTDSSGASNGTNGTNGSVPTTKSSTTSLNGSTTPPALSNSTSNLQTLNSDGVPPITPRPTVFTSNSNRYSVSGMSGLGSPSQKSSLPTSPYAPRITSISEGSIVYQKVLTISGTIADPTIQAWDGNLTVSRLDDGFPPTYWPVSDSHFKALVYLLPGPNRLRFDFTSPKLANSNSSNPLHSSYLTIHMVPPHTTPPLQLVIMLGKDSPGTFDAVPARIEREGNGIDTAIRKFRMAAYLWQAFTAEQMYRNKLGRRVFRIEEEWVTGTSNYRDRENGTMRSEAKVHVIRCDKTVAELRDLDLAQQNPNAKDQGGLFGIAAKACKDYFKPMPNQKQYCSVLLLDAHWDKSAKMITGHAALGGAVGEIQLAIFGSHALQSYPSSIEKSSQLSPTAHLLIQITLPMIAMSLVVIGRQQISGLVHICMRPDIWLGCPHETSGIMLRDYVTLNRSFTTREPYSTRTKSKGGLSYKRTNALGTDLIVFDSEAIPASHCPTIHPRHVDESVLVWPVDNGNVVVTAASGVAYLEIFVDGEQLCHIWQEFSDSCGNDNGSRQIQRQVTLTEQELRSRLPEDRRKARLKLSVKSCAGGEHTVEDLSLLASKASRVKLPGGRLAFRSSKLGLSQMEGSTPEEVVFDSALYQTKLMTQIKVYHGFAVDGIEFFTKILPHNFLGREEGRPEAASLV